MKQNYLEKKKEYNDINLFLNSLKSKDLSEYTIISNKTDVILYFKKIEITA